MKQWGEQPELHFDEKELKIDLGVGNFIFVGSSCDMWARDIPEEWIIKTLAHCRLYPNDWLFQSKNPGRFRWFYGQFSGPRIVFGTTIETNRESDVYTEAPSIIDRYVAISEIGGQGDGEEVMVTIEPIMDFDLKPMVEMFVDIEPQWVNIGADSGAHNLHEPPVEKIKELIAELSKFTEVKLKKNLKRILEERKE